MISRYEFTLTPGDIDFLRELIDFAEELVEEAEMQDVMAAEGGVE